MKYSKNRRLNIQAVLHKIEIYGNKLPHPAVLFLSLALFVVLVSGLLSFLNFSAIHPIKKELISVTNLVSVKGIHLVINNMVKNFSGFAPLGSVLVAMLGFSIAEKSGLISVVLKTVLSNAPRFLVIPAVFLTGVLSHTAGDIGYVLLIPLSGMVFHSLGMNPLAGIAACFAGVSGGFAANILLSTADPMLSGISQEAARIIDSSYKVNPLSNWYFMSSSSFLIIALGTLVTRTITIPYVGRYQGSVKAPALTKLTAEERRGLKYTAMVLGIMFTLLVVGLAPESGFLRDTENRDILHSPVIHGVVSVIFFFGCIPGIVYGYASKAFKNHNDVVKAMQDAMATMAPYIVLVFFAAQFISLFNASNIGLVLAVHGADILKASGLGAVPLMLGFVLLVCILDLFIGSASAKWTLLAPIFVPMFMLVGYSPELTQATYRIGDSVVNIISPLMSYFPLIVTFITKYDEKAKVGTLISLMLPFSVVFLLGWSIFLFAWMVLDLPLGPGVSLWYLKN